MSEDRLGAALAWCERYVREHGPTPWPVPPECLDKPCAVYVFRSEVGWCKVGASYDLAKRQGEVSREGGGPVTLLAAHWHPKRPNAFEHEQACHRALDAFRLPGRERFRTDAVEAWLADDGLASCADLGDG